MAHSSINPQTPKPAADEAEEAKKALEAKEVKEAQKLTKSLKAKAGKSQELEDISSVFKFKNDQYEAGKLSRGLKGLSSGLSLKDLPEEVKIADDKKPQVEATLQELSEVFSKLAEFVKLKQKEVAEGTADYDESKLKSECDVAAESATKLYVKLQTLVDSKDKDAIENLKPSQL